MAFPLSRSDKIVEARRQPGKEQKSFGPSEKQTWKAVSYAWPMNCGCSHERKHLFEHVQMSPLWGSPS